ncbi:MAG: DNA-directed RNA polymerase subunit beta', partial [bacterium]|nr:DNA-directed RNA polymerase subunit beta' [bacterium]
AGAQAEARILMLSANNIMRPAFGDPVSIPTQDMILGMYFLTFNLDEYKGPAKGHLKNGEGSNGSTKPGEERLRTFGDPKEAQMALDFKAIELQEWIKVRWKGEVVRTTAGRVIFNLAIPQEWQMPFVNKIIDKGTLRKLIADCYRKYGNAETAKFLDAIKSLGFHYATLSGTTVSISDVVVPPEKDELLNAADKKVEEINRLFEQGFISEEEQYNQTIDVWSKTSDDVTAVMQAAQDPLNPVFMMATSGARGSIAQVKQLGGMRGLMADPSGRILAIPIKANLKEGLTVLEYFISTHGARKGLADTALRTADSGYLTRRLVDVAQDVIIREEDCGTAEGITVADIRAGREIIEPLFNRIVGRRALENLLDPRDPKHVIVRRDEEIDEERAQAIIDSAIGEVKIRSVLTCKAKYGVCAMCYGRDLATGKKVDIGEAVGIIAAQSIGEPGTQLTLRTFHTGGVATEDIITGLPRVEELFEARKPKGQAVVTEASGSVRIVEEKNDRKIIVTDEHGEEHSYEIPPKTHPIVKDGDKVEAGDPLHEGSLNPHDVLRLKGERAIQNYLVREVQKVYRSQGVDINDKHIEVIVRSMMRKVKIVDGGATRFLPGQLIESSQLADENEKILAKGTRLAEGTPVLLGVTKASLATESFLSAASFQETTRVLTEAAIKGKHDPLLGLKENVIIGKLIPAGTGMSRYRNIQIEPEGQDIDEDGRPRSQQVIDDFGAVNLADEAALMEVIGQGPSEDAQRLHIAAGARAAEPAVQYEGEYDVDVAPEPSALELQMSKRKGISPEDLP